MVFSIRVTKKRNETERENNEDVMAKNDVEANPTNFLTQTVKTANVSENMLSYQLNWYLFHRIAHVFSSHLQ